MDVTAKFLGGAGEVTGSKYLIDLGDFEFLVDWGLFQGGRKLRELNWDKFPMPLNELEAVVLTHAHLDQNNPRHTFTHFHCTTTGILY